MPLNSIPATGNRVGRKAVLGALKAPLAAIADDTSGTATGAKVNAILAHLRTLGLITP